MTMNPVGVSDAGATRARPETIGRVVSISGSQGTVELVASTAGGENPTVGKFMGLKSAKAIIIGLITEVAEETLAVATGGQTIRKVARLDLIGEIGLGTQGSLGFSAASRNIRISAMQRSCSPKICCESSMAQPMPIART
jgi:hypothetical protein